MTADIPASMGPGSGPHTQQRRWIWSAALAMIAITWLASRAHIVGAYASDIPSWDDWDAFGQMILVPLNEGTLGAGNFFAPQNEHRIALSRLWSLLIYFANDRQWDNGVQALANVLPAAALWLLALTLALRGVHSEFGRASLVVLATIAVVAPYGWENSLYGLQSAFYWSALLALAAFVGVAYAARSGWALAGGVAAAGVSLVTVASGVLVPVIAAVAIVLEWRSDQLGWRRALSALAALMLLTGLGLSIVVHVGAHDALRAADAKQYVGALHTLLAWPGPPLVLPALVWWLPTIAFAPQFLRACPGGEPPVRALWLLSGWALANVILLAYARGTELASVSSRYTDFLSIGVFGSLAVGWAFATRTSASRSMVKAALLAATVAFGVGLGLRGYASVPYLEHREASDVAQRLAAAAYVRDGRPDALARGTGHPIYPDLAALARYLSQPSIQTSLPYSIARPLRLDPATRAWNSDAPLLALHVNGTAQPALGTAHFPSGDSPIAGAHGPGNGSVAAFSNLGGPFRIEISDAEAIQKIVNGPVRIGRWSWRLRAAQRAFLPAALGAGVVALGLYAFAGYAPAGRRRLGYPRAPASEELKRRA